MYMSISAARPQTPTRSSTFSFLDRIGFQKHSKLSRPNTPRTGSQGNSIDGSPRASNLSIPAYEGAGVKAQRMSSGFVKDIVAETCELDDEFASPSKIGRRKECGKGASATVCIMVRKGERKQYAVKEFRRRSPSESEEDYVRKVMSEYTTAKSLRHPNIVQTVRLCTHKGTWNHVMEYCSQGELYSLVERRYLRTEDKQCIFTQVLRGVNYLHEHGIAHRDIKLENLLMTEEGFIKITDFGVSEVFCGDHPGSPSSLGRCGRNMAETRRSAPGICGSKPYISPEVLAKDKEYDPTKLDVWSLAILYLTLVLSGYPWDSASRSEVNYAAFIRGWEDFLGQQPSADPTDETHYPHCGRVFDSIEKPSQRRCILKMLHPDPAQRCTVREVLNDRWIRGVDCCSPDSTTQEFSIGGGVDVSQRNSYRAAAKMKVQAKHDHLPPPVRRMPQHKFDLGDGTSRYD